MVSAFLCLASLNTDSLIRLCNVLFTTVRADINLENVTIHSNSGDFNAKSLSHVINTESVNKLVVQSWMDKAGGYSLLRSSFLTD